MSRTEKWAVAAIGAFLGTYIVPPFTRAGAIKSLLLWAISTLFCRLFIIWLPDKIRSKNAKRL